MSIASDIITGALGVLNETAGEQLVIKSTTVTALVDRNIERQDTGIPDFTTRDMSRIQIIRGAASVAIAAGDVFTDAYGLKHAVQKILPRGEVTVYFCEVFA